MTTPLVWRLSLSNHFLKLSTIEVAATAAISSTQLSAMMVTIVCNYFLSVLIFLVIQSYLWLRFWYTCALILISILCNKWLILTDFIFVYNCSLKQFVENNWFIVYSIEYKIFHKYFKNSFLLNYNYMYNHPIVWESLDTSLYSHVMHRYVHVLCTYIYI